MVLLIAQRQENALSELYDRFSRLVYSIALNTIGDQNIAEDITQDVFLRVWERANTYHPERGKVYTWIASITRYRAIDIFRRLKKRPEGNPALWDIEDLPDIPDSEVVENLVEKSQNKERLRQALARLPEAQRVALTYAYFYGYSHSQIAQTLNEPIGTVKTRIRLAMQKLRQTLETDFPE